MYVCLCVRLIYCSRKAARNFIFLLQRISKAFCVASSTQGYSFSANKSLDTHSHTHIQKAVKETEPQMQVLQGERVQEHSEFNLGEAKSSL